MTHVLWTAERCLLRVVLVGLLGCLGAATSAADVRAVPPPPAELVSDEARLRAFAETFAATARRGDARALLAHFALDETVRRGLDGLGVASVNQNAFAAGIGSAFLNPDGLLTTTAAAAAQSDGVVFRGVLQRDGRAVVRFRVVRDDGGFTVLDLALAERARSLVVVDVWPLATGEWMSDTLRRTGLLDDNGAPGLTRRLQSRDSLLIANRAVLRELDRAFSEGRAADALRAYGALPEELRRDRILMIRNAQILRAAGDDATYMRAIEDVLRVHPRDSAARVLALDLYLLRGQGDAALTTVDALEATLGPDPMLDVQRAVAHLVARRFDRCRELAQRAATTEPSLSWAHFWSFTCSNAVSDHEAAVRSLRELRRLGRLPEDLATNPDLGALRASRPYRAFIAEPAAPSPSR